jgi:glycosyl transferase family 22 (putative mannosyltransferase)
MRALLARWQPKRVALLLAPVLCAVWLISLTGSPVCCDAYDTLRMAVNLAHHGVMSLDRSPPYTPSMYREPVPALSGAAMVAIVDAVAGPAELTAYVEGERARWLKAQNLLWLLSLCASTYLAIRSFTGSLWPAIGGALLAQAIFFTPLTKAWGVDSLYTEIPSAAVLMLGSFLIARGVSRAGWVRMGLVGMTFGVLTLIKAATLFVFAGLVVVIAVLWAVRRERVPPHRALAGVAMLVLGCAVVVAPWLARNYHTFGRLRIREGSGMVLYFRTVLGDGIWPSQFLGSFYAWSPRALRPTVGLVTGYGPADLRRGGRLEQLSTFPDSGFLEQDKAAMFEGRPEDAVSYFYRAHAEHTRVSRQLREAGVSHPMLVADDVLMERARARIRERPLALLALTVPVLWRSAMLTFPLLAVALGWALWRRDDELLMFCLPAFALILFYGLVSHGEPRYAMPVLPIAIVAAGVLARSAWMHRGKHVIEPLAAH